MDVNSKDFARDRWKQARRNKAAHRGKFFGRKSEAKVASEHEERPDNHDASLSPPSGTLANLEGAMDSGVSALSTGADLESLLQDVEMKNYQAFCRHAAPPHLDDPGEPPAINDALLSVNLHDMADTFNSLSLVDLVGVPAPYVEAAKMECTPVRSKPSILEYFRPWKRRIHSAETSHAESRVNTTSSSSAPTNIDAVTNSQSVTVTPEPGLDVSHIVTNTVTPSKSDSTSVDVRDSVGTGNNDNGLDVREWGATLGVSMSGGQAVALDKAGGTVGPITAQQAVQYPAVHAAVSALSAGDGDAELDKLLGMSSSSIPIKPPSALKSGLFNMISSSFSQKKRHDGVGQKPTILSTSDDDELDSLLGMTSSTPGSTTSKSTVKPSGRTVSMGAALNSTTKPSSSVGRSTSSTASKSVMNINSSLDRSTSSTTGKSVVQPNSSSDRGTSSATSKVVVNPSSSIMSSPFKPTTVVGASASDPLVGADDDLDELLGLSSASKTLSVKSTGTAKPGVTPVRSLSTTTTPGTSLPALHNTGWSSRAGSGAGAGGSAGSGSGGGSAAGSAGSGHGSGSGGRGSGSGGITSVGSGLLADGGEESLDALLAATSKGCSSLLKGSTKSSTGFTMGVKQTSIGSMSAVQGTLRGKEGSSSILQTGLGGVLGDEDDDLDALLKGTGSNSRW